MPPLELEQRNQDAVVWAFDSFDSHGQIRVTAPEEIRVRWEWTWNRVSDPKGNNVTIDAEIVADADYPVGSLLWLGTLDDWYGSGSGGANNGLVEVVTFRRIPDDKGRNTRRSLMCRRFRNTLPEVV